ncbi:hypothetical protein EYF80_037296 [Liparis tanakae]|uniref:Uncharacterized protein n=1 Tax=Liparis tanakae TaxID=230148 RepID=A0A4Z2GGH9_9TELE|nr:hypothetical protein EYF80_037296 [Liparis tanakae]
MTSRDDCRPLHPQEPPPLDTVDLWGRSMVEICGVDLWGCSRLGDAPTLSPEGGNAESETNKRNTPPSIF